MKSKVKCMLILVTFFFFTITSVDASTLRCDKYLSKGYRGEEVKKLQGILNDTMGCNLSVDGIFGSLTKKCVQSFQSTYHLKVDGIVGINTCSMLNSLSTGSLTSTTNEKSASLSSKKVKHISVSGYAIVIGDKVNVRKSYTTESEILTTVELGKKVKLISKSGEWYKIKVGDVKGYIREDLLARDAIIVDISDQKLYFYREGKTIFTSKVVTGTKGVHDTPIGKYLLDISYKSKETHLKEFDTYVDYWMPFVMSRGIGFHDADKRPASDYTKDHYTYDGSHGCVNMQKKNAKKLYKLLDQDTIVVVRE